MKTKDYRVKVIVKVALWYDIAEVANKKDALEEAKEAADQCDFATAVDSSCLEIISAEITLED